MVAPVDAVARPSFRRILGNRSFASLWAGQLISQSGDFIFDVALLWLVLDLTGSPYWVGVTLAVELLPAVVIGPIAGVYVDRLDSKGLLLGSMLVQAVAVVTLASLFLVNRLDLSLILALVFLVNAAAQLPRSAIPTLIPRMVGRDDLMAANSLYSLSSSTNQLVSLSIGGIVIAVAGVTLPILYDGATFLAAAVLITFVARTYTAALPKASLAPPGREARLGSDILEAWHRIRADPMLTQILVVGLVLNFFGGIIIALLAPYARIVLGGSAAIYGFLLAAFALGTIVGSVALGSVPTRRYVGRLLFAGIGVTGVFVILLGAVSSPVLALGIAAAMGATLIVGNLPIGTLMQARAPGHMLGRVLTIQAAILVAPQPVGALAAGLLTRWESIPTILELSGFVITLVTAVSFLAMRTLRNASY